MRVFISGNDGKKSYDELEERYNDFYSRQAWICGSQALPGFNNDHLKIHENLHDLVDYINYLRDERLERDQQVSQTRRLLGFDRREELM